MWYCSTQRNTHISDQAGITIVLVLIFAGVFGLSVAAMMSLIFAQTKLAQSKEVREVAFGVAEAGLEYYHWFLIDNPNDTQNGTGADGPYERDVTDPDTAETIGTYSLTTDPHMACGQVQWIDITSVGTAAADTRFPRTVLGRHTQPTVAEYSYIVGDDVWAGPDREIVGPYHANGGIRMDGTHNAQVTSGVSSWSCDSTFGCSPTQTQNGIFGAGGTPELWQYPTDTISFDDMAASFDDLKGYAQADGVYLEPYGTTVTNYSGYPAMVDGYHLVFNSDGTVDIYEVTDTTGYWGWHRDAGYLPDFHIIDAESFVERRSIPSDCALIFVEDKVWIEGVVNGKVTVVGADLVNDYNPDVILYDDITYADSDGSDGLTVISEGAILIPPLSPDSLELSGIFVAQGRYFGRPYYANDTASDLTIHGTVVSNGRVGTQWDCSGSFCSGYETRTSTYDRLQTISPPPFTPARTPAAEYVWWQEL